MTDKLKIMTDNEIIKAFKDFLIEQVDGYTDHVETGGKRYEFIEKELELLKETDNLINRLQAENERLQDAIDEQDIDISRLYKKIDETISEAYKEFAERLKEKKKSINITIGLDYEVCFVSDIDDLLKELVGEDSE